MANVKIKGVDKLAKKLDRDLRIQLNKLFRDKALRDAIGLIIAEDIKDNVNFGAPSKSTLKWRKRYDPINKTDKKYSRGKLNATFTGELLNDLATNVKGFPTELRFEIGHSDKKHKKYQGETKKIGSNSPYKEISKGLIEKLGYDYFKLSPKGQEAVTNTIREAIFKLLS